MDQPTTLAVRQEIIADFCQRHRIRKLALFGSVLGSDFSSDSDIDVLVEFEPGETPGFRFFALQEELSAIFSRPVDLHTPKSPSLYSRSEVETSGQA